LILISKERGVNAVVPETCGQALVPPSTVRFAPLMQDDSGPATNVTILDAVPYRS
jgi:hypothetical protein